MLRRFLSPMVLSAIATVAAAQSFECSPPGVPFPIASTLNCENAQWNGVGPFGGARNELDCGMPAAGAQYALLHANGPLSASHPANTLPARPLNAAVAELKFDVPEGATAVSFRYNFLNAEAAFGLPSATYNDGMEIAICDFITGARIQNLVLVDTFSAIPGGACNSVHGLGVDTLAPGADTFAISFGGPMPAGYYLSVACWNSNDNSFDSGVEIDCITWGNSWEMGFLSGPRVQNTTIGNPGFVVGLPTSVQTRAGLPYIEGFHCMVAQLWDGNFAQQVPGIAGDFWPCTDRPWTVLSEGLLTGGINPGRGPEITFTIPMIAAGDFCGRGVVIQSYVITEIITNPAFTTALIGFWTDSAPQQP